ncbi:CDP-diacylglycerol--serine O-phosphatidyltransferase [uncultured Dialister sp.]|uniref:CDP-diacylglycerol--serine O-phosphatidyltransferase n=2 Tax=uncultured Dialister sp. TaxID=278064 RepID=UPI0026DAC286|nr:CDP-diacylglycerol--serine O-phosphatidyltransferase [uncultured Dialister sp.]
MNKSWIANAVTATNALFGGLSIMMSIQGNFKTAAVFILIAMVADALDGRVARALHTAGPMGVELDSLSDDISFGIAAGALMYAYQLHELGPLGFIPCALLGTFCAFRLARFNVKVTSVHGYFEGLPCPTTGVIVAAYVLSGIKIWNWLAVLCVLLLAFLMVSEIHYPDNKGASADQLHLPALLICLAFFIICTIFYWPVWAAALCAGYIMFGMMNTFLNRRKAKRKAGRTRRTAGGDGEGKER